MWTHLSALAVLLVPLGNVIGPLVVWLVQRKDPFVNEHGKEAVNFQLSVLLYALLFGVLVVATMGADFVLSSMDNALFALGIPFIFAFIPLLILEAVAIALASERAMEGVPFRYPLRIRFIR